MKSTHVINEKGCYPHSYESMCLLFLQLENDFNAVKIFFVQNIYLDL